MNITAPAGLLTIGVRNVVKYHVNVRRQIVENHSGEYFLERTPELTIDQMMRFAEAVGMKEDTQKDTNPKDAVGIKKVPMSCVSAPVMAQLALAMFEGARKYGRHNYRVAGVRASVYYDAALRHLYKWWEGEDIDRDSGLSHIIKAIASLHVLFDAMVMENWVDDRPPSIPEDYLENLNKLAADIVKRYPDAADAFIKGEENGS